MVVAKQLSVREAERLVRRLVEQPASSAKQARSDPDVRNLERNLAEKLGAKVVVKHTRNGKGTLVIHYTSLDELDGILARVK